MSVPVEIDRITVALGGRRVLDEISLEVRAGEFLTLLGPSGSGKTTTLNVVAGFAAQASGSVRIGGVAMDAVPVERRDVGYVFQSYALFPQMSVAENVGFALEARRVPRAERQRRVEAMLELVRLQGLADRRARTLSGGQQQRVALARALVFDPRLLLLDEPLAALDQGLRQAVQLELKRIQAEVGVTTVAVTHDQNEAMTMSDRIALLNAGRIEQVGTPEDLYLRPASVFVADFLGESTLLGVEAGLVEELGLRLEASPCGTAVLRPEALGVVEAGASGAGACVAHVEAVVFQGARHRLSALSERGRRLVVSLDAATDLRSLRRGDAVTITCIDPARIHVIPATRSEP